MIRFVHRIPALVLALCLLAGTACASGLDGALSGYLDLNADVHYAMSAQIKTLSTFGDATVDMLNGVLRHLSVGATLTDDETSLEISVAEEPVLTLTERLTDDGSELVCNLLPNRTLRSASSAMDQFSGHTDTEEKFDFFRALSELESCYQQLTNAIIPYAEEKKANYKITGVATSKWSRIARLTPEQSEEISPLIEQVLGCGMDEEFRRTLKGLSANKGFIVGLYQTDKDGKDLALYMKGYVTFADGVARNLAYQWAFTEKEGVRIDTFKYELLKSKKTVDTREIHATFKRRADTQLLFKGDCEARIKDADGNITTTWTYDLSGKESSGVRPVKGTVSKAVRTVEGETASTDTLTFTPSLKLTSSEGSGVLSGSVDVEAKTGKNVHTSLQLLFDEEPARLFSQAASSGILFAVVDMPQSSLTQNVEPPEEPQEFLVGAPPIGLKEYTSPEEMQVIDLDAGADLDALLGEASQNLAGRLLIALTKIPPEDAALISDNLSQEDYEAFLEMVDAL